MSFKPVRPKSAFDDDGHSLERKGGRHEVLDECAEGNFFGGRHFEDEFVVHLEDHA